MPSRARVALCLAAGVAFAVSCHSVSIDTEPTGESKDAIQGGEVDTKSGFAVGVVDRTRGVLCSGALIAPNLVLTARHCVSEIAEHTVHCTKDRFGKTRDPRNFWITTDSRMQSAQAPFYRGKTLFVTDDSKLCGNDIALLELENNVPDTVPLAIPAIERPLTDASRYSRAITAIGYGATSPSGRGSGTRRVRENIPIDCIPNDAKIACPKDDQLSTREFVASDGTCQGDSGSSAFEQRSYAAGQPIALGVLSRGGQDADADKCLGAVYTRVDSFRELVIFAARAAARDGDYMPPSWVDSPPFDEAAFLDAGGAHRELGGRDSAEGASGGGCSTSGESGGGWLWMAAALLIRRVSAGRRLGFRRRR